MNLANKIVWITGASSGIGEALAHEYVNRGAKIIISSPEVDKLNKLKEKFNALRPGSAMARALFRHYRLGSVRPCGRMLEKHEQGTAGGDHNGCHNSWSEQPRALRVGAQESRRHQAGELPVR